MRIRMTATQASWLREDWYYRHARYEHLADGEVLVAFGEGNRAVVFELLRWLGRGAELLEPPAWRAALRDELAAMLATYEG